MYGNVDDPTSASCKSDDPIWCTVKLDASGSQTPARPANKPWAEDVAFLVYNLESDKVKKYEVMNPFCGCNDALRIPSAIITIIILVDC